MERSAAERHDRLHLGGDGAARPGLQGGHGTAERESETVSRWQMMLEVIVTSIRDQIAEVGADDPGRYLPFIGTLFLFIATANLLAVVPGYVPPTGSLSTAAALALCVLIAVPLFSIGERGLRDYLSAYVQPTPLMLPFNIVAEISRTIALAVRLTATS